MYARYVPQSAGAAPVDLSNQTSAPASTPATVAAATMATPTAYARYVPGAVPEDISDRPAKKARLSPQPEPATKSSSKKRKSKRRTSAVDSDTDESSATDTEPPTHKAETADSSSEEDEATDAIAEPAEELADVPPEVQQAPKKPKREKKSKKTTSAEAQSESDDEIQKRHKAVFERKRKSMLAPPTPSDQPADGEDATMEDAPSPEQAHGLEPLPQPKPAEIDDTIPTFETLPAWLAEPIRVSPQALADFDKLGATRELGISAEVATKLASVGYKSAFAIQTAVIPLLLPHHCKSRQGDVLVSAATGSGKTLSYALPMIRDLSHGSRRLTRLRALIVLPTRELVKQAQQVCEEIAGVFASEGAKRRVRIGVSMGSQNLEKEQASFVEREEVYDPIAYSARQKRLALGDYDQGSDATDDEEKTERSRREDRIPTLPEHVIQYKSKIDVLICTPGRLVEHIKYTPGFTLDYVRWLVVDEADKLLGQDFQQWLDVVIPPLQKDRRSRKRNHHHSNLTGVRKVILSATMTRDLERLGGLKLRRPSLVVLEGAGGTDNDADQAHAEHALPELLEEAALKVSDPNVKPVFLVDLLRSKKVLGDAAGQAPTLSKNDADTSSSESNADTSSSESESDADTSSSEDETSSEESDNGSASSSRRAASKTSATPSVLIFTKSNETAMRLSRLLSLISPKLTPLLGTLTSTTAYSARRQTLRDFTAGKLRVLVASDLVARGIDLPSLDHVINYDMPTSVASYVHRVGRTARAGKSGRAWTLFTKPEARWFWTEIAGGKTVTRAREVQRIRITEEKEDLFDEKVKVYETALEALGQEAGEMRKRGRN
ncbi:P-loop containing nucleoside triphosphate hydrolase protein [Microdochium trichocladiopsis]|uniref:ATP-dependent RNA helicase n=1 Tax=Microdochium trichocladiopsis TaxID=1682393 RepID=A0A9P8YHE0_9PEZI|nr:P-loop containing nucleoside triphosphate hydrolase protein [Microdochium trichocladiopsis]KAH7040042.1 P-loop containing nucleoside triphosphate hydrolase protein [Microdochium trichocladiopsis]